MTIIIILFYASLSTIIVMVGWKLVVLRALKLSLIDGVEKDLHGTFYQLIHELLFVFRARIFARVQALTLAVFFTVAHKILHLAGVLGVKLKERHGKWFDMVKGKGIVRKKNSASFFLRNVAEYKESVRSRGL